VKIKSSFFNTLYLWTAAFDYLNLLSFHDFLDLLSFLTKCFSCILLMYLGCTFCAFNDISIIYKKKSITWKFLAPNTLTMLS
jgi:hypothetical protein